MSAFAIPPEPTSLETFIILMCFEVMTHDAISRFLEWIGSNLQ